MISPAIGRTWRPRFPGLARLLGLPWLVGRPGAAGWLGSMDAFCAPKGCADPALARALWPAVRSMIAAPRLGCGPTQKWLRTTVAVAVSTGQRVSLSALLCAIASLAALACVGVAGPTVATGAAAPAFAAKRNVLRARRFADPGDRRTKHLLDVFELLEVVGGHEGQ